jgi:hypothetical protein
MLARGDKFLVCARIEARSSQGQGEDYIDCNSAKIHCYYDFKSHPWFPESWAGHCCCFRIIIFFPVFEVPWLIDAAYPHGSNHRC